jgi:hypothetical protein
MVCLPILFPVLSPPSFKFFFELRWLIVQILPQPIVDVGINSFKKIWSQETHCVILKKWEFEHSESTTTSMLLPQVGGVGTIGTGDVLGFQGLLPGILWSFVFMVYEVRVGDGFSKKNIIRK